MSQHGIKWCKQEISVVPQHGLYLGVEIVNTYSLTLLTLDLDDIANPEETVSNTVLNALHVFCTMAVETEVSDKKDRL